MTVTVSIAWVENVTVVTARGSDPIRSDRANLIEIKERKPAPDTDVFLKGADITKDLR